VRTNSHHFAKKGGSYDLPESPAPLLVSIRIAGFFFTFSDRLPF
jgi:hypothetical protein